ncbi:MAG: alanine racemase, partial [Actinomycetes bacterium]
MSEHLREAVIDLDAVRDNTAELDRRAGDAGVMAVVKADAYGHGLVPCAQAAVAGGARWLGVALTDEALTLRRAGVSAPILAWLTGPGEDYEAVITADVDVSVNSVGALQAIVEAASSSGRPARIHLNIDSGLGRAGATVADWPGLVAQARRNELDGSVCVVGVWSHFAYADAPGHPTINHQVDVYREALAVAEREGLRPQVRHLANSAAALTRSDLNFDLVRPGLALYGLSPVPTEARPADFGLRPAMSLRARFTLVKDVPAGYGVSYQHQYVTTKPTSLGLLPVGYADGVPRNATNVGPVLAAGRRRSIAGTVCMDQVVIDLDGDACAPGDVAVLFGSGDGGEPTAQD